VEMHRILRGIGARDADVGAAAEVNPAHLADVERGHMVDVTLHDPLEPVADAEHVDRFQPCPDRGGTDDTVDPRRRPAPDQDRQSLPLGHRFAFTRGSWDPPTDVRMAGRRTATRQYP